MINHPQSKDTLVKHNQPDYGVEVDQAASLFTPIPKRVMNGSEEGDVLPAAVLSGAPIELQARTVRIYRPAKTATQSGDWHGHHWRMDWDILSKGHRWENPLMGWQSSADFMQGIAPTASSSSTTCCTFYCNCNCLQFCTTTPTTIRPIRPLEPKRDPTDLDFLQSFVPPSILHFRSSHTIPSHCLSRPNCIGTQTQPTHTPTTLVPHISTEHLPPNFHLKYSYQTLPSS